MKIAKDSAAWIELGRSFHQEGTVNEKVCESDFVPLCNGTIKQRSPAERKLLEAHKSEVMNLGAGVQAGAALGKLWNSQGAGFTAYQCLEGTECFLFLPHVWLLMDWYSCSPRLLTGQVCLKTFLGVLN